MSHDPNSLRTPLARVRGLGAAKSGTGHFWLQRLTAVANIPLTFAMVLIVLMLAKLDYAGARALVANPLVGILLIAFLVSAFVHMRLGMQVIIEDYVHLDRRIAAAVEDLAGDDVGDVGHGCALLSGSGRGLAQPPPNRQPSMPEPAGKATPLHLDEIHIY